MKAPGTDEQSGGAAAARVTGFWHVGLTVRDMAASIAFYRDGLGFEVYSTSAASPAAAEVWALPDAQADVVYLRLPGSDAFLELLQFRGEVDQRELAARPWDVSSAHFCVYVDDLDALYVRLAAAGHRSRSGGVTVIGDGPLAGSKAAYLLDPSGYHVELFERRG